MDLTFRNELNTEQSQQLILTPEMVQSLNILRLGGEDLLDYIFEAIEENPVLDINEEDLADRQLAAAVEADSGGEELYNDYSESDERGNDELDYEWEWYNYYYDNEAVYSGEDRYTDYAYDSDYRDRYEYESVHDESLTEHLNAQLEMYEAPYLIKAVADYIIQTLDDNGYLTLSADEIENELNVEKQIVREALDIVQSFDPAGVACADLRECLSLQLKRLGKWDAVFENILGHFTEDFARNRLHRIAKALGLKVSDMQRRADILRSLEPKPGNGYSPPAAMRYIIPDVKVKKIEGEYGVFINRASSPRIWIREEYLDMIGKRGDPEASHFLSGRVSKANWLIRALKLRDETILKVTREIVLRQKEFFENGREFLKPMKMQDVADALGMHESTISRTANDKYLLCAQGVYELKYFFNGAVGMDGNLNTTSESVKVMISKMIDAENKVKPLSDRAISEALRLTGVDISRRTVAKYRDEMGIPASNIRRRIE